LDYCGAVPLPTVYLESSVISYLAARPSRDIVVAAHQQLTHEWWDRRREKFELYVSVEVLNEIRRGDADEARRRLAYVESLPVLAADEQARGLAAEILRSSALPAKAVADALHIAIATVNGMEFLLTWNCTHIANGIVLRTVTRVCREAGFEPPTVVTPEELMEG
jgi:predicted nucleic acid-binding protein